MTNECSLSLKCDAKGKSVRLRKIGGKDFFFKEDKNSSEELFFWEKVN